MDIVPLLGEKNEAAPAKADIDMVDVDNLIEMFYNIDVYRVEFEKDIKRYELAYPRSRSKSFYDMEVKNYIEAFEPL